MKLQAPRNENYCATVVTLTQFKELAGCDNVQAAVLFGCQVIVGRDAKAGDRGLFFPVETQLSKEFAGANNLFRKAEHGNVDPSAKGYFEEHGRVKCMKFRGHRSEGFFIPLSSLRYIYDAIDDPYLDDGIALDMLGDHEICRKYVAKRNPQGVQKFRARKVKPQDRIVPNQFRFHLDTANLQRNIHRIQPDDMISISEKWHGTSAVFSNILVKNDLNILERVARFLGVRVQESAYQFVWSSRAVIKGVGDVSKPDSLHYYGEDVWEHVGKQLRHIPKGYTVYGEIVGYTPGGSAIQRGYHYGCEAGTHKLVVYRVTSTNVAGQVLELSWAQTKQFCQQFGLTTVLELFYGSADTFCEPFLSECSPPGPQQDPWLQPNANGTLKITDEKALSAWQQRFLTKLLALYCRDQPCRHNRDEVPAEGVVVSVEHLDARESYKAKNFAFLERESKLLDKDEQDLETEQSQPEEAAGEVSA